MDKWIFLLKDYTSTPQQDPNSTYKTCKDQSWMESATLQEILLK